MVKEKDKKLYFISHGLHKPVEYCDLSKKGSERIDTFIHKMKDFKVYENTFENEHLRKIKYEQYNTNDQQ